MTQHFLLSPKARTLSLTEVARMSDDEAYDRFRGVRFAGGVPVCPHSECDGAAAYEYRARRIFKCKRCEKQFSVTSGTIFASRKLAFRDILYAIAAFINGVNGFAALRLSRDLRCDYKTAFVLQHKLREVIGALQAEHKLTGTIEIDGIEVGGWRRKANKVEDRVDTRKLPRHPKSQSIVTMRERRKGGRSKSFVFRHESEAVMTIIANVHKAARIRVDEALHWVVLEGFFDEVKTINHDKVGFALPGGVNTNRVESFHSRIRRAERGVHCHIAGRHLQEYADELAWREDHRRVSNGVQFASVFRQTAKQPVSQKWSGYWKKAASARLPQAGTTPTS